MVHRDRERIITLAEFCCADFTIALSDYRQGLLQKWHSHDEPILILLLAGYTREEVRGRNMVAGPLDIGIKPAGIRHQDHFWPKGVRAFRIVLSSSLFAEVSRCSYMMNQWEWLRGSEAIRPLLRAVVALREQSDSAEIENCIYDSLAAMVPTSDPDRKSEPPQWLRQTREQLESCYASGVRLRHLANDARVHPVYLARMFRRFFGCSVGEHVRNMQLQAVSALLADESHNLAEIAYRTGFSDQAHMTRAFASRYWITPGHFRRLIV